MLVFDAVIIVIMNFKHNVIDLIMKMLFFLVLVVTAITWRNCPLGWYRKAGSAPQNAAWRQQTHYEKS